MGYIKDMLRALFTNGSNTNPAAASNARIPVLDSNNNVIGSDSINAFASVLGGIETRYKTAVTWEEEIDSYHGNALYLCGTSSNADDPFKSASFLLRIITAYTGNNPRTIQEAISVYGASTGTRRYRVYSNNGWSQWFTVGTV